MDSNIQKLKELLETIPKEDYYDYFGKIAKILMNQCYIQKGDTEYQIIEIEFYLYTPTHTDVITYPREIEAGRWFFHQSGVDLTFKSNRYEFGGILIRGLKNLKNGKMILGPLNCVNVLWDEFDAFTPTVEDYPQIKCSECLINHDTPHTDKRWIPVSLNKRELKLKDWIARLPDNKNSINIKEAETVVFDSHYRFIMDEVIDFESLIWKRYSAKPKSLPTV